jgi:hypothetical protein
MKRILAFGLTIAVVLSMLPAGLVHADGQTLLEDQSYTAPGNAAVAFTGPSQYVAQTFTAGLTGALTGVSIDVASGEVGELYVRVVGVTDGVPNGTVLGERFLWTPSLEPISSAPLSYVVEFAPIYVTAGTQYAIVVNYTWDGTDGTWSGGEGDPYPRGSVFLGDEYTLTQWTPAQAGLDLHFRTFVVTGVPVSDLEIEWVSGAKKAHACEIFKETYRITNLGPDAATWVRVSVGGSDHFNFVSVDRMSGNTSDYFNLAVGESRLVVAYVQVTGYVPGETKMGWVSADTGSDPWPDIAYDPAMDNNHTSKPIRMVGKPVMSCWP